MSLENNKNELGIPIFIRSGLHQRISSGSGSKKNFKKFHIKYCKLPCLKVRNTSFNEKDNKSLLRSPTEPILLTADKDFDEEKKFAEIDSTVKELLLKGSVFILTKLINLCENILKAVKPKVPDHEEKLFEQKIKELDLKCNYLTKENSEIKKYVYQKCEIFSKIFQKLDASTHECRSVSSHKSIFESNQTPYFSGKVSPKSNKSFTKSPEKGNFRTKVYSPIIKRRYMKKNATQINKSCINYTFYNTDKVK